MAPVKTLSYQIPSGETVPVTIVRLSDGRLVPRHPDELIARPTPPPGRS